MTRALRKLVKWSYFLIALALILLAVLVQSGRSFSHLLGDYNQSIATLTDCIASVHRALKPGGLFCFNAVDKSKIDNRAGIKHNLAHDNNEFGFQSSWYYGGEGEQQQLQLSIEKTTNGFTETWHDQHAMVALTFAHLQQLLEPYFEVHILAHDYERIAPWENAAGNAFFVAIKH